MRPIRLEIQAFGPYAGTLSLNMSELGEKGIYAIIGETGSGKTTIFDAIVFALYGRGSGEDRDDGKALRAVAASPELETKVELEFVCGGKTYTVIRRPTQLLTGKRKKELVENKGSVVLIMPDGTRKTDSREIDGTSRDPGLIERDILGVTKDQFCQTVMIAQGEFRKLLRAKTDERTEILRRVFRTQRFDALSRRMEQLSRAKKDEIVKSRSLISFALKAMRTGEDSPLRDALEAMNAVSSDDLLLQDAQSLAAELTRADEEEYRAAVEASRLAEVSRDLAKQALDQARALQDKKQRRAALAERLVRDREELEKAGQRSAEAEARQPELQALDGKIAAHRLLLPQYEELERRQEDRLKTERDCKQANVEYIRATEQETRLKKQEEALTKEAASLSGAGDRKLRADQALRAAQDRGRALDTLRSRAEAFRKARRTCEQGKKQLAGAAADAKTAAAALDALIREREQLGNTAQAVTVQENAQRELDAAEKSLAAQGQLLSRLQEAVRAYGEAAEQFRQCKVRWEAADAEARRLRSLYNANIAGLMARELQEGSPCVVCGSVHHPIPAALAAESATEEEVNRAEAAAEKARSAFNDQSGVCSARSEAAAGLRRQLAEVFGDLPEEAWAAEIEARSREIRQARARLTGELEAARAADQRFRTLQAAEPEARAKKDQAENAMHEAETRVGTAEGQMTAAEKEMRDAAQGLMPDGWTELDLSDAIAECDGQRQACQIALNQAEADVRRQEEIGRLQTELAEALRQAAAAARSAESSLAALKVRLEERRENYEKLLRELPWPSIADCRAAIAGEERQRSELDQAIRSAKEAVNRLNQTIASVEGELRALDADLAGAPQEDIEKLEEAYKASRAAYDAADNRKSAVSGRMENNARHRKTLEEQVASTNTLEHEYRVMQDVSDTANGKVRGQDKVTLETYVQAEYFDRIIAYANQRLIHMSRRQYELARQLVGSGSKQGKTGLELDVIDHNNAQRRAVGTLSGGEGFLASLSFALGMSDAIQDNAASAVQLDTMFVDEGFGSLSESYLNLVMDELNDTADTGHRLIGIISHVDEVKEGIDRGIEVTKSETGISTARIY